MSTMQGERPLRADAQRNRDKLLTVAVAAFAEHGIEASLEDIARQAGVGHRHALPALPHPRLPDGVGLPAPGRAALRRRRPSCVATHGRRTRRSRSGWSASSSYVATKRGMAMALKSVIGKDSELFAYVHGRIRAAVSMLLTNAVAGRARSGPTSRPPTCSRR